MCSCSIYNVDRTLTLACFTFSILAWTFKRSEVVLLTLLLQCDVLIPPWQVSVERRSSDASLQKLQEAKAIHSKSNMKSSTLAAAKPKSLPAINSNNESKLLKACVDDKRLIHRSSTWDCLSSTLATLGNVCRSCSLSVGKLVIFTVSTDLKICLLIYACQDAVQRRDAASSAAVEALTKASAVEGVIRSLRYFYL